MALKLRVGDFFVKDKRQYEVTSIDGSIIEIKDCFSSIVLELTYTEISDLIFRGEAKIVNSDDKVEKIVGDNARDFSSYPEDLKEIALDRWKFVNKVIEKKITKYTAKWLDPVIKEVIDEFAVEATTWRTLERWIQRYEVMGMRGLIPQHEQKGNSESRVPEKTDEFITEALLKLNKSEKISYRTAHTKFKDAILIYNSTRPIEEHLPIITYQAFIPRAKRVAPYEKLVAQIGKQKADVLFKSQKKAERITKILDRAEIDHTVLDLFIIDEYLRLPLGRPTVTAVLDRRSRSILGIYIGFEPPSFLSVSKAVKNAISDKTQLIEQYENVEGKWYCRGVFNYLATDVGKDLMSKALEEALLDIGTTLLKNPVKKPWYKGAIESYFKTLNQTLLDDKPGKVFSNLFDSNDYDPQKNAVISMSAFMEIFYIWLVDIYQCTPKGEGEDEVIPNVAWLEDEVNVDTDPVSPERLEIIFSENDTRTNRDKGIRKFDLWYSNNELTLLRKNGFIKDLKIKTNRENISKIKVLHPVNKVYFDVPAVDQEYTQNLTLHQHDIIRKYRKRLIGQNIDELSLAQARQRIEDIIEREIVLNRQLKISNAKRLSRYRTIEGGGNSSVVSDEQKAKIEAAQSDNPTTDGANKKSSSGLEDLANKLKKERAGNKESS
jgi:putative transposase